MDFLDVSKSVAVKNAMVALKDLPGTCTWLNVKMRGFRTATSLAGSSEVSQSVTADI